MSALSNENVAAFMSVFSQLPKSYGKSILDNSRSLAEILARAEKLPTHLVGLEGATKDRHTSHLRAILGYAVARGYVAADPNDLILPSKR